MNILSCLIVILFALNNETVNEYSTQATDFELIVFEGSDWCANCRQLEKEVLTDSVFLQYLQEQNIQLTKIDFPQRKKISKAQEKVNRTYAEKYKFQGDFPTIILSRTDILTYEKLIHNNQNTSQLTAEISELLKKIK